MHIPGKLAIACEGETNYLEREAFRQGAPAEHKVGVGARGRAKTQFASEHIKRVLDTLKQIVNEHKEKERSKHAALGYTMVPTRIGKKEDPVPFTTTR